MNFSQTSESMNKQYLSEDKEKLWYSHPVSHSSGMISSPNILQQEPGPSCFAQSMGANILFTSCGVWLPECPWYSLQGTNDEVRCVYKGNQKEIDDIEMEKKYWTSSCWCLYT